MRNKRIVALVLISIFAIMFAFAGGSSESAEVSTSGRPVLRVAMECGYAPYNWTQPTDANGAVPISGSQDYAYGYDVMMAKLSQRTSDMILRSYVSTGIPSFLRFRAVP